MAAQGPSQTAAPTRRIRPRRVVFVVLVAVLLLILARVGLTEAQLLRETWRTTPVYDPPVLAGQPVYGACSAGFYTRRASDIVLTMSAHCATEGATLRDAEGRVVGVFGQKAQLASCPAGRFCSPSDIIKLVVDPARIPWGRLNEVDMGAGGYRTFSADTAARSCGDISAGQGVEVNGRGLFRSGAVQQTFPYQFATDTMFPCMVAADIEVGIGDSGGAVLVNGQPAGITSRELSGQLGFTPLAEGLDNLGLTLCTDPNCGLTPPP